MDQHLFDISSRIGSLESIQYLLISLAVFIEGPLATVVAAAIAAGGALKPGGVFLAAGIGNLAADFSWYALGYAGRYTGVIQRLPWLRNQGKMIDFAGEQMRTRPIRILVASKLWFGVAVIPALIATGLLHVSWYRLLPAAAACEIVWTGGLVLTGYFGAGYLGRIENIIEWSVVFGMVSLAFGLIVMIQARISAATCKVSSGDM